MEKIVYDNIIIGGGPAGLTAAIYIARAGKKVLIIEKKNIGSLAAAHKIENYPGITESITGSELLEKMKNQALKFGAEIIDAVFLELDLMSDNKIVKTDIGKFEAKTVIAATGIWKGNSSKYPGEEEFLGRGVSYCATCDGAFYRGMNVSVIGSGEEAVEEALYLTQFVSKLYLISNKEILECEKEILNTLEKSGKVEILYNKDLVKISGNEFVEKITVRDLKKEIEEEYESAAAFIYMGTKSNFEIYAPFANVNDKGYVVTNEKMESLVDGVYIAGDIREKSIRQITTAVSDGTVAAAEVLKYLLQNKKESL